MAWEQTTWWFVGTLAMVFSMMSLLALREKIIALVIADAAAWLLWWIWAINAFGVEQVSETGVTTLHNYPSLGYFAFAFGVVMVLDLFMTVIDVARAGSGSESERDFNAT